MKSHGLNGRPNNEALLVLALVTGLAFIEVKAAPVTTKTPPVDKEQAEQSFQGKVEAVDSTARTLTVGGKVVSVTSETKIKKGSNSINLSDVKVGDAASGMARHGFNGKIDAVSISIEEKKVDDKKI